MSIIWTVVQTGLIIGAAAGIATGTVVALKNRSAKKQRISLNLPATRSISELVKNQMVCKTLTAQQVVDWMETFPLENMTCIFGRMTEKSLPIFTSDRKIPQGMDTSSYLFLSLVNKNTKLPVAVKLVNCSGMDKTLSELLGANDYALIMDTDNK